ncbi:hypothetical protein [Glutamicibacter sp.]|uniref:hypothetical protein n=1 Tax=Glutamicibacter sp. TaxID=1931995 RepID=UPI0028BD75C5|nr:hypothetical protein [Glutamicibacter sp.]
MDTFIKGPSKRDVAGMKAAFGSVATGDIISVLYKTSRFGNFLITGKAHATVLDDLMVGGLNAAAAVKKAKGADGDEVSQRQPDKDVRAFPAEFDGEFDPIPVKTNELHHGDLVVASFNQEPYGDFLVTGVITEAENDPTYLMVGPWIVQTDEGAADRLLEIKRILAGGEHVAPVPSRRTRVEVAELA